jgi:hypothetical protein
MTKTSTKNNTPKKTLEHSTKSINTDISTEEHVFSQKTELKNIINSFYSSVDIVLSQPNKSMIKDIINLLEDTIDKMTNLLKKEAYKRLKEKG